MESCSSKKRKLCRDDHQEEDNDEEKMEKFFALVKSIREARDRLKATSCPTKEFDNSRMLKRKPEENKPVEVWKPTFQREDFLDEIHDHHQQHFVTNPPPSQVGSSQTKQGTDQKEEKQEAIDLRLSL